jgi:phosphate transport system substrate-binding protein
MKKSLAIFASAAIFTSLIAAPAQAKDVKLTGGGATFAAPLLDKCKGEFATATGDSYTYASLGSGAGRSGWDKGDYDFAWSDTPHATPKDPATIHVPVTAAPVAVIYNVPGVDEQINLTADIIAEIFSRKITMWNDPKIAKENNKKIKTPVFKTQTVTTKVKGKNVKKKVIAVDKAGKPVIARYKEETVQIDFPKLPIVVVYRNDSSGTSGVFTSYLAARAPAIWTKAGNNDFTASFPSGSVTDAANFGALQGAKGSEQTVPLTARIAGAITYAESNYAKQNGLPVAKIKNNAGNYTVPDAAGVSAFLGSATTNANGTLTLDYKTTNPAAYELGTTSYALVSTSYKDPAKGAAVKGLMTYILNECPKKFPETEFAVISGALKTFNEAQIAKIK